MSTPSEQPLDPPPAWRVLTSPRMLAMHATAVLGVLLTVGLGVWQYGAWQQHRTASVTDLTSATPRPFTSLLTPDEPFPADALGRPATIEGRWLPQDSFSVSGRDLDGRTGYWAVTPVAVCDPADPTDAGACATASGVLVVRGWSPDPVPASDAPRGRAALTGWLQAGEAAGDADTDPDDDVLTAVRVADVLQRMDRDLYSAYAIQRDPSPRASGLLPVTPDALPDPPTFTALRNLLYALEWWAFTGFVVFVWWRWCRDELAVTSVPDEGEDEPADPDEPDGPGTRATPGPVASRP